MKRRQRVEDKTILYAPHTTWLRWSNVKINIKCVIVQGRNCTDETVERKSYDDTLHATRSTLKWTKQSVVLEIDSFLQKWENCAWNASIWILHVHKCLNKITLPKVVKFAWTTKSTHPNTHYLPEWEIYHVSFVGSRLDFYRPQTKFGER